MIINKKRFALYHFSAMKLPDEIKTIENKNEITIVINKSSFIAQVYPILSENDIKEYLINAKKKYYDASHHCYAFKLSNGTNRYSDAGEPNGTAGLRIQNAIEHFALSNQLVIVSRIFGGIKLGVGPLGKAYYQSAFELINNSNIITKYLFQKATISIEHEQVSFIHRLLRNHKSIIEQTDYSDLIKLTCWLKSNELKTISSKISEYGRNQISLLIHSETVYK